MALKLTKQNSNNSLASTLKSGFGIAAFLRWWGQGLLLWLPASLRRRLVASSNQLAIVADADEIRVVDERGGKQRELVRYLRQDLTSGNRPQRVPKVGDRRVVLRLMPGLVLCNSVNLPVAAENNLRQVVGFDVDRLTPFRADQVFYDAKLIQRLPESRQIQVRLGVVLRSVLTPLLTQLRGLGLTPDRVEIESEGDALNLLPAGQVKKRLSTAQRLRRLLLLSVFVSGLAAAALPLWQQRSVVVRMIPLVDQAEADAQQVLSIRNRLDNAVESSQFLLDKRRSNVLMVDLLSELTAIIPDNTYLEQASLRNGRVELRGKSSDATSLIGLVEDSELFVNATFSSPVVKDNRSGLDRFVLTAAVTPVVVELAPQAEDVTPPVDTVDVQPEPDNASAAESGQQEPANDN